MWWAALWSQGLVTWLFLLVFGAGETMGEEEQQKEEQGRVKRERCVRNVKRNKTQ